MDKNTTITTDMWPNFKVTNTEDFNSYKRNVKSTYNQAYDTMKKPIIHPDSSFFIKDTQFVDRVHHPKHYTWLKDLCGIEVIDITRNMDFDLGNVIKYVLRQGHKSENGLSDKDKAIEDLEKAKWYLEDKINTLKNN